MIEQNPTGAAAPSSVTLPIRVVSGGQTGVDRAALDAAMLLKIPVGGWCPRGRRSEAGRIPRQYPLRETDVAEYGQRTFLNIRDSAGTLILTRGRMEGGTALTRKIALEVGKPYQVVDFNEAPNPHAVLDWLVRSPRIEVLNVAGPRASQVDGIYDDAFTFLQFVFSEWVAAIRSMRQSS